MTGKIYLSKSSCTLLFSGRRLLKNLLIIGLFTLLTNSGFAQIGPYSYGNPVAPPAQAGNYYTMGLNEGLPKYLDPTLDNINPPSNPNFLNDIISALPERVSRANNLGFGSTVADLLVPKDSSEVYLTFVTEGAGYRNALGYYLYKGDIAPNDLNVPNPLFPGKTYLESRRIIFPNASLKGKSPYQSGDGGGQLVPGQRVKLIGDLPNGRFSKNVKIAWFVVSDGWNGSQVTEGKYILYSNPIFNPGKYRQAAVLDFTPTEDRTVITFEDRRRTSGGGSDNDFNDVVFYVNQVSGGQVVFYPDCSGKLVLTEPIDLTKCEETPPAITNLTLTPVCSDDPLVQLKWRITNPNVNPVPFTWIITDGVTTLPKLSSQATMVAPAGESFIFSTRISGNNTMTIYVEGVAQTNGRKASAFEKCPNPIVVTPLNCCALFAAEVTSFKPGTKRDGANIPAARLQSSNALGASGIADAYVSLGFSDGSAENEASIVVKFAKPVKGFVNIYETTFGTPSTSYIETADVYGSIDGSVFYKIGIASNQEQGSIDIHKTTLALKDDYAVIQYLKIVNTTPKAAMPNDADGFDLEAVCASDIVPIPGPHIADPNSICGDVKVDANKTTATQGKRSDGTPVWSSVITVSNTPDCVVKGMCDPEGIDRSNKASILSRDANFFSLGLGGSIEIEFETFISGSLILFERTGDPKPTNEQNNPMDYTEKVAVYVKTAQCNEWIKIGTADNQGPIFGSANSTFDHQTYKSVISLGGRTVKFVKLVDISPANSTTTDGYDLDYICATVNAGSLIAKENGLPLEDKPVKLSEQSNLSVNMSPNPSTGTLTLDFGYAETGKVFDQEMIVTVADFTGKAVLTTTRAAGSSSKLNLNLSQLQNGFYFVTVHTGEEILSTKIVLQR